MEENPSSNVYDDYKFVSRKELEALGLDHLIGTDTLKAYMHGFFVDLRLYEKVKQDEFILDIGVNDRFKQIIDLIIFRPS